MLSYSSYCFPVLGCGDVSVDVHSWYRRDGDIVTVGCEGKSDKWQLVCVDGKWIGDIRNCSTYGNKIFPKKREQPL